MYYNQIIGKLKTTVNSIPIVFISKLDGLDGWIKYIVHPLLLQNEAAEREPKHDIEQEQNNQDPMTVPRHTQLVQVSGINNIHISIILIHYN